MTAKPKRAETAAEAAQRRAIAAVRAKYLFKLEGVANTVERGRKTLWVAKRDEGVFPEFELWAYVTMDGAGMHGSYYTFQEAADNAHGCGPSLSLHPNERTPLQVWSDKRYLRNLTSPDGHSYAGFRGRERAKADGKYVKLEDRIIEAACRLIAAGSLLSPAERKQRNEVNRQRLRESAEHIEAQRRAKFEGKARELVSNLKGWTSPSVHDDDIAIIIDALEWAQTQ